MHYVDLGLSRATWYIWMKRSAFQASTWNCALLGNFVFRAGMRFNCFETWLTFLVVLHSLATSSSYSLPWFLFPCFLVPFHDLILVIVTSLVEEQCYKIHFLPPLRRPVATVEYPIADVEIYELNFCLLLRLDWIIVLNENSFGSSTCTMLQFCSRLISQSLCSSGEIVIGELSLNIFWQFVWSVCSNSVGQRSATRAAAACSYFGVECTLLLHALGWQDKRAKSRRGGGLPGSIYGIYRKDGNLDSRNIRTYCWNGH